MTAPRLLLLATRSRGKLHELRALFLEAGIDVTDLRELRLDERPEEQELERYDTFEENARAKADFFHRLTGMPTVADDSGLQIEALGGRPGVLSKRWCGRTDLVGRSLDDANNAVLEREMKGIADRRARYVCAAVFQDAAREIVRRGEVTGTLVEEPRGTHGFGFDPYFVPDDVGVRTFGELTREEKQGVSHRARAVRALIQALGARG
jgi:XTP/dITP diphosphohydrolase